MSDTYELREVVRDAEPQIQLKCPGCGIWQDIDDDQFHGRVSLECEQDGCTFHETIDLSVATEIPMG